MEGDRRTLGGGGAGLPRVSSMRRVWGVQAALAQARLISWRVWTVGRDRLPTAEQRRAQGPPAAHALDHAVREHAEQFWLGIQGGGDDGHLGVGAWDLGMG